MRYFKSLELSHKRNVWIGGDVHGCLKELKAALGHAQFIPTLDYLCLAGDILNKGAENFETVCYLRQLSHEYDCVSIVPGNHEGYLLKAWDAESKELVRDRLPIKDQHTAPWMDDLEPKQRQYVIDFISQFPYALEITCGDRVEGIIHADFPKKYSWNEFKEHLLNADCLDEDLITTLTDSRRLYLSADPHIIQGIDRVWFGHTPTDNTPNASITTDKSNEFPIRSFGNRVYIDSGAAKLRERKYPNAGLTLAHFGASTDALTTAPPCQRGFRVVSSNEMRPSPVLSLDFTGLG